MYCVGPYLIGIGASTYFNTAVVRNSDIIYWLLFFTLPANLFIYGLNDIADSDTDVFNQKKGTYEAKVEQGEKKIIVWASVVLLLPFIPLFIRSSSTELWALVVFLALGALYSLPPVRLKARPIIDSLSNGPLYTMAGIMGYAAAGGHTVLLLPYLGAALWASTMHLYSAIPDIEADTKAGIRTSATVLGARNSLFVCMCSYLLIAFLLCISGYGLLSLLAVPYLVLIGLSFRSQERSASVFSIYKIYPYVTYCVGALVYAVLVQYYL
jgi:4-hydroxybenzoate polyprenyltransferase